MKIGILTTRDELYHGNHRLLEAIRQEGHNGFLVHPAMCSPFIDGDGAVYSGYEGHERLEPDVLLPRIGSTIDEFELSVARHFEVNGVCLFNTTSAVSIARDKFSTLQALAGAGIDVPKTVLLHTNSDTEKAVRRLGGFPLILKARRGRRGKGVLLVKDMPTLSFALGTLHGRGEAVLLQEFVSNPNVRDLRVLVLRGKVPAAMGKRPAEGDFRSNIGLNGKAYKTKLTSTEINASVKAAQVVGLDLGGVDLLSTGNRTQILEVNYTPGFKELERVNSVDVARAIIRSAVEKARTG